MSNFWTPSKNPWEKTEVITKKVSEIKETILSEEQKNNFKDVLLTLEQASRLKEGKLTIEELTKIKLDQFKKNWEYSPEKLHNSLKKGVEDAKDSAESAEEFIEKSFSNVKNSAVLEKTQVKLDNVKDKVKEIWTGLSWEKLENLPFIWWLFKILSWVSSWFKWFFKFWDKAEKWLDKTKKLLDINSKEYKETLSSLQNSTISWIEKLPWVKLNEQDKKYLKAKLSPNIVNSYVSKEDFEILMEKVKKWEKISESDLKKLNILDKAWKDPKLEKIFKNIIEENTKNIANYLDKQYWITTDTPEKFEKFKSLVNKYFNIWEVLHFNKETSEINWKFWIFDILIWIPSNIIWFLAWVTAAWLIDASRFILKAWEKWKDVIEIWIASTNGWDYLWKIFTSLNFEDLYWSIDNLGDVEKWIMIRLFQRHLDTFLLPIHYGIKSITALSLAWAEVVAWKWDFFSTRVKPIFESNNKTIERVEKIYSKLWITDSKELKDIQKAMNILKESYISLWAKDLDNASRVAKMEKLLWDLNEIKTNYTHSNVKWTNILKQSNNFLDRKLWANKIIANELLEEIKANIEINKLKAGWTFDKIKRALKLDFFSKWNIESIWDRALLYFDDKQKLNDFLNTVAKESWNSITPKILSRIGWIVVSWVIFNEISKWNFKEWLAAAVPFMWPMMLIKEWSVEVNGKWYNPDIKVENWTSMAIWWTLLAVDWWFLIHDVITKWFRKWISYNTFRYFHEIKDLYKDTAKLSKIIAKYMKWGATISEITKAISKIPKFWKIWTWLILATVTAYAYWETNESINQIEEFEKNWILTENWFNTEKLSKIIPNMPKDELEKTINILYTIVLSEKSEDSSKFQSNIDFNTNTITISPFEWYSKDILEKNTKTEFELLLNELSINMNVKFTEKAA